MKASIIVIGTELTRGIIEDKHGALISRELTHLGVHVLEIVALPDDGTIQAVLGALMRSSDLVIITGGLGPTSDDMTRSVIAQAAGKPLVRDESSWNHLVQRLGEKAYGANARQAMIPEGFSAIPNPNGTAPGFYGYGGSTLLVSLPGPPREMDPMFYESVVPLIREKLDLPDAERDEYTSFITAEAKLEELYESVDPELDWATRFQDYRISLYVSGGTKERRDSAIRSLRELVGEHRIENGSKDALGMAVDGNIIIFERIKDEFKSGKKIPASVKSGFKRASIAVIDGNVTTIIASIILAWLGTGAIRGFAYTLLVSMVVSMFTTLVVTRGFINIALQINSVNYKSYGLKKGKTLTGKTEEIEEKPEQTNEKEAEQNA